MENKILPSDQRINTQPTVQVIVGSAGSLSFEPTAVEAPVGTLLIFNFLALNHTLTQSSFSHPCENIDGFDTGFNNFNPRNTSGEYITQYVVETTEPQWFFCAQEAPQSHCEAGMVFTLNGQNKTHDFVKNAYSSNSNFNDTGSNSLYNNDKYMDQTGQDNSIVEDTQIVNEGDSNTKFRNSTTSEEDSNRTVSSIILSDSDATPSQNDSSLLSENIGVRKTFVSVSGVTVVVALICKIF